MDNFLLTLISGFFVAGASGLIGSFLVLRKMTLLSDALSHVALPGIALGIILNFEPLFGGLVFLGVAAFIIWQIEHKTKLAAESITGVFFVTALAAGVLLVPEHEILEAFFGDVQNISINQAVLQTMIAFGIIVIALKYLRPLVLISIAPELTPAEKISRRKIELLLLILITLTITIGIGFVGILLMSALSIIPAVTARNLAKSFNQFIILSVLLAISFLLAGLLISKFYFVNPGISTVLIGAAVFFLSLFRKK
jgi:zinc transport system permease protein